MTARNPEDLGDRFAAGLNAGDIEAVVNLYEPQSVLRAMPGQSVEGTAAIREAIVGFLAMKPTMKITSKSLGRVGDIALITSMWELSGTGADGEPVQMTGESVEVARRQADGSWRYLIDSPWGLEWSR